MSRYARTTYQLSQAITTGTVWAAEHTDDDWAEFALCRESDPGQFYPEQGVGSREAKRICSACPVRVECLQKAFDTEEEHGIWGTLTGPQRKRVRQQGLIVETVAELRRDRDLEIADYDTARGAA